MPERVKKTLVVGGLATLAMAVFAVSAACLTSGCSSFGYYAQSVGGHLSLLKAARPVPEVLADSETPQALRARLLLSQQMRDFVPNHESAQATPELARRYPLAMISPPARNFLNSSFVNVKSLRDIEGEPLLEMHAADAAARRLSDGQTVRVFNARGRSTCRLRISPRARPGVVNGLGIWWRKLGLDGTNVNELTHQRLTDIGRGPTFYDCLVEVEPA